MDIQYASELEKIADCLVNQQTVHTAIHSMAAKINHSFAEQQNLLVICLLNGGIVLTGQLLPELNMSLELDYIHVTRYGSDNNAQSKLRWIANNTKNVAGRNILMCDDIFDEGKTLAELHKHFLSQGAASVHSAVMADKKHCRKPEHFKPDFIGLELPDRYVFGMGMDYSGLWRNAPGIFAVKEL